MKPIVWTSSLAVLLALAGSSFGEDWPQFRGPNHNGVSSDKSLPTEWSADKNIAWKAKIPGRGWSQPIVWGDKIFLTAAFNEKERVVARPGSGFGGGGPGGGGGGGMGGGFGGGFGGGKPPDTMYQFNVLCLDLNTGKEVWKKTALESKPKIATHSTNTYATETPVTDGERVYAYFGMHGLYCYDLDGKLVWKKDLGAYSTALGWGTASSPVLDGDRLFLQIDNEEKSFVVALNKKTGDEIWRKSRTEKTSYATPVIWKTKNGTQLVTSGSSKARAYDPATGELIWELTLGGGQCSASPIATEDAFFVGIGGSRGGFGGGGRPGGPGGGGGRPGGPGGGGMGNREGGTLFAVKAGATGDVSPKSGETSSAGVAWATAKAGPSGASPLYYKGYIYVCEQHGGMISCYDAKTGKAAYTKERIPSARSFWASPWAYDDKIFCLDDAGTTHVIKAGPEFDVIRKNSIGDQFWASAGMSNGTLLLRGVENLYCVKQASK